MLQFLWKVNFSLCSKTANYVAIHAVICSFTLENVFFFYFDGVRLCCKKALKWRTNKCGARFFCMTSVKLCMTSFETRMTSLKLCLTYLKPTWLHLNFAWLHLNSEWLYLNHRDFIWNLHSFIWNLNVSQQNVVTIENLGLYLNPACFHLNPAWLLLEPVCLYVNHECVRLKTCHAWAPGKFLAKDLEVILHDATVVSNWSHKALTLYNYFPYAKNIRRISYSIQLLINFISVLHQVHVQLLTWREVTLRR